MVKRKNPKPEWQLIIRGDQREPLEADLVAQIVLMLARQLAHETLTDEAEPGGLPSFPSDEGDVS